MNKKIKDKAVNFSGKHSGAPNKAKNHRDFDRTPEPKLSNRSVLDVEISGLDDEGYGISASETHALRIGGALPGDTVRAGIDHVAMRMAFGHVKKYLCLLSCAVSGLPVESVLTALDAR